MNQIQDQRQSFMLKRSTTKGAKGTKNSVLVFPMMTLLLSSCFATIASAAEMFPFVLPWDDASVGPTDMSGLLEAPAGKAGFVTVRDGHLFADGKRLRIFGVNMAFGANFPTHADAEKVAGRMAKFGINCVRFHHMDMQTTPGGIFAKDGKTLDADQLDRLDYFIAELKKRGIYTNLNLHVSRTYPDRPRAEKQGNDPFDKGVDNFSAELIALQKSFARELLTHVNAYTGNAYIDEPAVALVEINNENGLLNEWSIGALDRIAPPYRAELSALWTAWLRGKYGSDEKLGAAWAVGAQKSGPEMLRNGSFGKSAEGWTLETHEGAEAKLQTGATKAADRPASATVEVTKAGRERWHVQLGCAGLKLAEGETYAVTFEARADADREITVSASQAHAPWGQIASRGVKLNSAWQSFTLRFRAETADENARVIFTSLAGAVAKYEFANVSFRVAGLDGSVPTGGSFTALNRDEYAARTESAQRDWHTFLWATEEKYWTGMRRFIREDLKSKSLIIGTQLGWSPFPIQAQMDVVDSHAYWQHPHFPSKSWDMDDWIVKNEAMTGAANGSTIAELALQRVAGKPYIVSEYNHSAPNTFSAETFPLICAYAALQDWDGIFAFAYSHRHDDWDKRHFPSFFDIDQHPVKMATLPGAVATFLRGDVARANTEAISSFTLGDALEQGRAGGVRIVRPGTRQLAAMRQRTGVQLAKSAPALAAGEPFGKITTSDTRELSWDTVDKVVTVNTPRSKAVLGFAERRSYDLGGVKIEFGALRQGFGVVQVTVLEGDSFLKAKRILVTATADIENTGMKWTSPAKESVGRNWGAAPSLVEGVPATITFASGTALKAWSLDERGQRSREIPMIGGVLKISPEHRTLWYEIVAD